MIIGLEWIVLALLVLYIITFCLAFILRNKERLSSTLACTAVVCFCGFFGIGFGIIGAQEDVNKHYHDYIKLQAKVAVYDKLNMFEQYGIYDEVITYNLWYERNKSDLENVWTPKGSSNYAKEFDYIVIGGK